jgi:hypothetical protein
MLGILEMYEEIEDTKGLIPGPFLVHDLSPGL